MAYVSTRSISFSERSAASCEDHHHGNASSESEPDSRRYQLNTLDPPCIVPCSYTALVVVNIYTSAAAPAPRHGCSGRVSKVAAASEDAGSSTQAAVIARVPFEERAGGLDEVLD
ncbi:hypothetical protein GQ600_17148 [Phytophthora cactorum]|nr:hypothetical protein GQ600_17148 [Phytophthora cactorum]